MTPEELHAKLTAACPKAAKADPGVKGAPTYQLSGAEDLIPTVTWLKNEGGFQYLDMVTAVDYQGSVDARGFVMDPNPNAFLPEGATPQVEAPTKTPGFNYRETIEVLYLFSNLAERMKVFLKVVVPRGAAKVPSLIGLYKAADWQEREIYDLLGVHFDGHPNLTKILTPDFLQGHPLRKDYVHVPDKFD